MDNGLVLTLTDEVGMADVLVLILIVVDNGLVQQQQRMTKVCSLRLNPYCSGQWSRTCTG